MIDRDLDALFSIGPRGSIAFATGGPMLLPAYANVAGEIRSGKVVFYLTGDDLVDTRRAIR